MRALIALATLIAVPAAAQEAEPTTEYGRLYKAATENTFACFGEEKDEACQAYIAGIEAAHAAPDATEAVQHHLFKEWAHVSGVRGENLREAGKAKEAVAVLDGAYQAMIAHYEGGKHFHTLIDNLRLQKAFALALLETGDAEAAEAVIGNARGAADMVHGHGLAEDAPEKARSLFLSALAESEDLERVLAEHYTEAAEAGGASEEAMRDRAIEAWRRNYDWTLRAGTMGAATFADGRPEVRLADSRTALGSALWDKGDKTEAAKAFLEGATWVCPLVPEDFQARHNSEDQPSFEEYSFANSCERARTGWYYTSDETEAEREAAFNSWYDEQLEIMQTDISALTEAMSE